MTIPRNYARNLLLLLASAQFSCASATDSSSDDSEGEAVANENSFDSDVAIGPSPQVPPPSEFEAGGPQPGGPPPPEQEPGGVLMPPETINDGVTSCVEADLFCENFESVEIGSVPTDGGWKPLDASCGLQQGFSTSVSALPVARGESGRALNAQNHAYAQCRLTTSVPTADEFWVRSYLYWDESVDFSNKETLSIEMMPAEGVGKDDPSLRFGIRSKEPCTTSAGPQITMIGLGGGEVTGCDGKVPMPQGKWVCFEAHVDQSANLLVETFIDGQALTYESVGKEAVDTLDLGNPVSSKIDHLRLGFFTHNSSGKGDVWIDEVAMATTRLGCAR